MLAKGQAVDHRDRRLGRELDDDLMRTGPGDDRVDEPLEVVGNVADALAGAHDDVLGQVDRVPAELVHPGLERDTRPEARLLEEHRQRPADERRGGGRAELAAGVLLGLEPVRPVEDPLDLVGGQVRDGQQVAAVQGRDGAGDGVHHAMLVRSKAAAARTRGTWPVRAARPDAANAACRRRRARLALGVLRRLAARFSRTSCAPSSAGRG
jgi:hypothetical protein